MNTITIDKKMVDWATERLAEYKGAGEFLLLEQEGQAPVYIRIKNMPIGLGADTVCRVSLSADESNIEIESTRNLSAFLRIVKTNILYGLPDTAFAGYLESAFYDSESGRYLLTGIIAPSSHSVGGC